MFTRIFVLFGLLGLVLPKQAEARRVYLNDVPINSVRDQTFTNVSVRIDSMGNVYIYGKQYQVKIQGPASPTPPSLRTPDSTATTPEPTPTTTDPTPSSSGKVTIPSRYAVGEAPVEKYVLLIQRTSARASGYAVKLRINGRLARNIPLHVEQDVVDITPFLKKGSNEIVLEASKMNAREAGDLNLKIYPGQIDGGQVKIKDDKKLDYTRKGAEMDNFRHIYTVFLK